MLKYSLPLLLAFALCSAAGAEDYQCSDKAAAAALKAHDQDVADRAESIAEMKGEIADTGGSTPQQKQALEAFEKKLDELKGKRADLVARCVGQAAP